MDAPISIPLAVTGIIIGSIVTPKVVGGATVPGDRQQIQLKIVDSWVPPGAPLSLPAGSIIPMTIPYDPANPLPLPAGTPFSISASGYLQIGNPTVIGQKTATINTNNGSVTWT